jgi:hypothetical protein
LNIDEFRLTIFELDCRIGVAELGLPDAPPAIDDCHPAIVNRPFGNAIEDS